MFIFISGQKLNNFKSTVELKFAVGIKKCCKSNEMYLEVFAKVDTYKISLLVQEQFNQLSQVYYSKIGQGLSTMGVKLK